MSPGMRQWSAKNAVCKVSLALVLAISCGGPAHSQSKDFTVEKLLQGGWEIAGYLRAWENRTLILFRHKDHAYLVQCSVLIDVTRNPRVVPVCYEIR